MWGCPDFRAPDYAEARPRKHIAAIPTLVPCAIDQEPYFRLVRDNCERMENPSPKTALILSKFLTALQGSGGKMSASDPNSAIFMSDTPSQIKNKINKFAFSGGGATREEHEKNGGNPDVDVSYAYLSYFLEDDAELTEIEQNYRKGTLSTGDLKKRCIEELQKFVSAFQERRALVTEEIMREFMTPRKMEFTGNPNPTKPAEPTTKSEGEKTEKKEGKHELTKGERKALKIAEKKAEKEAEKLALRQKKEGEAAEEPKTA